MDGRIRCGSVKKITDPDPKGPKSYRLDPGYTEKNEDDLLLYFPFTAVTGKFRSWVS